jgi:hypothetical protein
MVVFVLMVVCVLMLGHGEVGGGGGGRVGGGRGGGGSGGGGRGGGGDGSIFTFDSIACECAL